jgi:hypothetical protein
MIRRYCGARTAARARRPCARIRVHMGRTTSWYGCLPFLVLAVALVGVTPGEAVSFALADRDREQAIRMGKKSIVEEQFGAEWRLKDGAGQTLVVMTPFHRLALAARNSAFRSQELKPRDIQSVVKDTEGKLTFRVTLRGGKTDFARFFAPTLLAGTQEVKASFVQNERTALQEDDGRYAAQCVYEFPAEGVDPKGRVVLVVKDAEEREVAKFTVDLAAMR